MASRDSENSKTILTANELRDRELHVPQYSREPSSSDFGLSLSDLEILEEEEQKRSSPREHAVRQVKVMIGITGASTVVCFLLGIRGSGLFGGVLLAFLSFPFAWMLSVPVAVLLPKKRQAPRYQDVLQYKAAISHWEYWEQRRHQQEQRQKQHQEEQRQKQEQQRRYQEEEQQKREHSDRSQNRREDTHHPGMADPLDWCYTMLGVSSTTAMDEIREAYHKKAKMHHPDLGGDPDAMITLNRAFELIEEARGES